MKKVLLKIPTIRLHEVDISKLKDPTIPDFWYEFGYRTGNTFCFRSVPVPSIPDGTKVMTVYSLSLGTKISNNVINYIELTPKALSLVKGEKEPSCCSISATGHLIVKMDFRKEDLDLIK